MKLSDAMQIMRDRLYNLVSLIGALLRLRSRKPDMPQKPAQAALLTGESEDQECARFPDQCPTTTALGKGIQ